MFGMWIVPAFSRQQSAAQVFTELISSTTARSILCATICAASTAVCLIPLDITKGTAWP
jgi:hypothetical protein